MATATQPPESSSSLIRLLRTVGPAVVVAAVVLGPGSLTTASRVGATYGFALGWVVILAALLMAAMTVSSLVIGVGSETTPADAIRRRLGALPAIVLGVTLFGIVALFQSSNNRAVLLASELLLPAGRTLPTWLNAVILLGFNALAIAFFLTARSVYRRIQKFMMVAIGLMLACFLVNAVVSRLSLPDVAGGLVPSVASLQLEGEAAARAGLADVLALFATTFSVAGAFYQAYLVRERGWTLSTLRLRVFDTVVGIGTLGLLTLLVMSTAASTLYGQVDPGELGDLRAIASSLRPTFGPAATWIFGIGILAGAVSSFVGNAMIGGAVLSDSVGAGGLADQKGPRRMTVAALLVGMTLALISLWFADSNVQAIIIAQGLTTLGLPLMAVTIFGLLVANRRVLSTAVFGLLITAVSLGVVVALILSGRTAWNLWEQLVG